MRLWRLILRVVKLSAWANWSTFNSWKLGYLTWLLYYICNKSPNYAIIKPWYLSANCMASTQVKNWNGLLSALISLPSCWALLIQDSYLPQKKPHYATYFLSGKKEKVYLSATDTAPILVILKTNTTSFWKTFEVSMAPDGVFSRSFLSSSLLLLSLLNCASIGTTHFPCFCSKNSFTVISTNHFRYRTEK